MYCRESTFEEMVCKHVALDVTGHLKDMRTDLERLNAFCATLMLGAKRANDDCEVAQVIKLVIPIFWDTRK